ncbi:MAG: hypothetical protein LBP55_09015 [Candidatus Adiutrix sp.]|jgi:hypothetical protein|nr:hypothetical protein [Candidatus Adiutrix sp.]
MIKLLLLYTSSLSLAWLSLHSLLFGLAHWAQKGAPVPAAAGLLGLILAGRLILATVRVYRPPPKPGGSGLLG